MRAADNSIFEMISYSNIKYISTSTGYTFNWYDIPEFVCDKVIDVPYGYDKLAKPSKLQDQSFIFFIFFGTI